VEPTLGNIWKFGMFNHCLKIGCPINRGFNEICQQSHLLQAKVGSLLGKGGRKKKRKEQIQKL
jgi:hypothetical protein